MRTFKSPYKDETVMVHAPAIISADTLNPAHVVPLLSHFLADVEREAGKPYPGAHGIPDDARQDDEHSFWESDQCSDLWAELYDAIQDYAPPFCDVGGNEGDGACIGVWPAVEAAVEDFKDEELAFEDPSEVPDDHHGQWLEISDHGNVTLYFRDEDGHDTELWAVV